MEITAQMVKTLRDKTNAGMMDCKKALQECDGDLDKAVDWLRQKGLLTARKRAGRATREGLTLTARTPDGRKGAIVEFNTETDFVAKMESFKEITLGLADYLINAAQVPADVPALLQSQCRHCGRLFADVVSEAVGKTGENMRVRRFAVLEAPEGGLVHGYVHGGGRLAVLIALKAEKPGPAVEELAHNLAMHVAAANPMTVRVEDLSAEFLAKEKAVYQAKAEAELEEKFKKAAEGGKKGPNKELIKGKIVEGQILKLHAEVVLLEQPYVKEPAKSVGEIIKDSAAQTGQVEVLSFVRFQLGEEIEGETQSDD
jgi:elongation factor Ts